MGNLALPCKSLTFSCLRISFAFVSFSLLRLVPFTNPLHHVKELLLLQS